MCVSQWLQHANHATYRLEPTSRGADWRMTRWDWEGERLDTGWLAISRVALLRSSCYTCRKVLHRIACYETRRHVRTLNSCISSWASRFAEPVKCEGELVRGKSCSKKHDFTKVEVVNNSHCKTLFCIISKMAAPIIQCSILRCNAWALIGPLNRYDVMASIRLAVLFSGFFSKSDNAMASFWWRVNRASSLLCLVTYDVNYLLGLSDL